MDNFTCGPQCPFWNRGEDKCIRPGISPEWVKEGQDCLDALEDWQRRPGEIQDEMAALQREADLYAAARVARAALKEVRGDALPASNTPSSWCWGGEKGKCTWLDIGLDGAWPDAEHKCTCPDRCCEGSWFKEAPPHA